MAEILERQPDTEKRQWLSMRNSLESMADMVRTYADCITGAPDARRKVEEAEGLLKEAQALALQGMREAEAKEACATAPCWFAAKSVKVPACRTTIIGTDKFLPDHELVAVNGDCVLRVPRHTAEAMAKMKEGDNDANS